MIAKKAVKEGGEERVFYDARKKVNDTTQYPYCCIGLVRGELGGERYFGTGCLINGNVVLTAAHNIYCRKLKQEGTKLTFSPGINGMEGRECKVKRYRYHEQYREEKDIDEARKHDIGVLVLEEDLGNEYGWIGIDSSDKNTKGVEQVELCGYPVDKREEGEFTMWKESGKYEASQNFLNYRISTEGGNSGSPLLKIKNGNFYTIGVHVRAEKKENVAIRLTSSRRNEINEWVGEITGKLNLCKLVFI